MPAPHLVAPSICLLALVLGPVACLAAAEGRPGKPLLAHWTFDEPNGLIVHDSSGNGCDATADRQPAGFHRVQGVFGGALSFSARHRLECPGKPAFGDLGAISFSVWAAPKAFQRYNELFRKEDGDRRVLFSFQENGRILSLGLNIGGYFECDAKIEPAQVLDGRWHHCAATFDGRTMRVYLDGREVGARERPGTITAGGPAPGSIGSTRGAECFEGRLDDLRIYAAALTSAEVAAVCLEGREAIANRSKLHAAQLTALWAPGDSLAETVSAIRRRIREQNLRPDWELVDLLSSRLQSRFPDDATRFSQWTGQTLSEYLLDPSPGANARLAGRLVELALEYMPLTEYQWRTQSAEDRRKWEQLLSLRRRFDELKARGPAGDFSPDWFALMFDAGSQIQFRPAQREAVAPYVTPSTPETRALCAEEARALLHRDWLHQADEKPTPERIRAEIAWARQLAERIASRHAKVDFTRELAELARLEEQARAAAGNDPELYFRVRELKRAVMFRNPVVDFDKLLLVDMPLPAGSEPRHETRHRLGYMAVPGARLLVVEGLRPDAPVRQLMPQSPLHGSFWRPDVSWDGRKVLFCFKPHNEKSFHLYEINADGSGLVQLTDGPFDDLDPIYLADGEHILFSTTRAHTYVRCMPPTNAYILARCDRDGRNIYLVSQNNEPDYLPSLMHDGRVIYTRWEYTDKPLWRAQGLWTMNPDGTQVMTFWGNQSVWPDLLKDARAIPGSRRVMFTGSAHHNWFSGSLGIVDPDRGFNYPDGVTKITAELAWPESGNGPEDPIESPRYHASGVYAGYYSPYPLSEEDFLVSASRGEKFVLYLMDVDGNRELVYEGLNNVFHAMPLAARRRPPVLPDRVAWPTRANRLSPADGILYSGNVYQGAPPALRDQARFLRVLQIDAKTYTYWHKRPYLSTGPVVSALQSEGVKRVLGSVPIEADGSVAFRAPTGKALHFQLLDENGRALQTMRSFVGVMPGEYRGCRGCHESHSRAPSPLNACAALTREPRRITPPPWGEDTVSYVRYVQPVLDKYCNSCHAGQGEAVKTLDLSLRPAFLDFTEPYLTLIGRPTWGKAYERPADPPPGFGIANPIMVEGFEKTDPQAYQTPPAMTFLSYRSRLIDLASSGQHYNVKVDPLSLARLTAWIDAMCPYSGDEEVRAEDDPEFPGVDWLAIRPRVKTAPQIIRPGPVD